MFFFINGRLRQYFDFVRTNELVIYIVFFNLSLHLFHNISNERVTAE